MRAILLIGIVGLALNAGFARAANAPMPFESKAQHLGASTCSGSSCHGSAKAADDVNVLQNEYFTWNRDDAHSNAYKLLLKPEAKRIASTLGLGDPSSAKACLVCHTDFISDAQKGRRYAVSDGVSCEACHGGAQNWLGPHMSGGTHANSIQNGMYPLAEPAARTRLCLQCHLGTGSKPIDHKLMGAGHPALDFEVSFYTSIQPAHFKVDADYRARKSPAPDAKLWAIGQLVSAEVFLDGLLSPRFQNTGLFPELMFFDCNACHHPVSPPRWTAGVGGPLGPGQPRLADASLVMSSVVLSVLAPDAQAAWNSALTELHRASAQSVAKTREVAQQLRNQVNGALTQVNARELKKAEALDLLDRLAQAGLERHAASYSAARQIYYGMDAVALTLRQDHGVAKPALKGPLDDMFAAVDAQRNYDPEAMRAALKKLRAALPALR